jgi:hypothetical protein
MSATAISFKKKKIVVISFCFCRACGPDRSGNPFRFFIGKIEADSRDCRPKKRIIGSSTNLNIIFILELKH